MDISKLKPLDILHCKGKGLVSSIVKISTKSDITHTAIIIENWKKLHVAESHNKKGVISTPLDKWLEINDYEIIVSRPLRFHYEDCHVRANEKMGWVNYPLLKMIWLFLKHYITGKWSPVSDKVLYCTKYVMYVLNLDLGWLTPVDLYDYCKTHKDYKTFKI